MKTALLILVFFVCFISFSLAVPEIIGTPIVANIDEGTGVETKLIPINCTSDTDFGVFMVGLSPSTPCGDCFQIYQTDPLEGYYVYFLASQGELSYKRTQSYDMTVECRDGFGDIATANVQIRVRTNEAPTFNLTSDKCKQDLFSKNNPAGTIIFDSISAADPNNDSLTFSMTTDPPTDNFEISVSNGTIRAKNTLKMECNPAVTFHISVKDEKNPIVRPKNIQCNFDVYTKPTVSNINKDLEVPENKTAGSRIIQLNETPRSPTVKFEFYTNPPEAQYLFEFNNDKLMLVYPLDYENEELRTINITILPNNGYCDPIPHFLNIIVTDCNDDPLLTPKYLALQEYEGKMLFKPGFFLTDEDKDDVHYYSIISGDPNGYFSIDPSTGVISSIGEYNVDLNAMPNRTTLVLQVNDTKGYAVDTATLYLTILDANDNAPVLTSTSRSYSVTECTGLGKKLGFLRAKDEVDSSFNLNNEVFFDAVSNGYVTAAEDGEIYLTAKIPAGQTSILTVNAKDRGPIPYQQTSLVPATISVSSTACTTNSNTNTNSGSGSGSGSGSSSGSNSGSNSNSGSGSNSGSATTTVTTTPVTTTTAQTVTIDTGGTCEGFFCDTTNILALVLGGLGALGLLAALVCCCSRYGKNICKKSPEAKAKAKEKAKSKTKTDKNASRPQSFDFWSNSVV